MDSLDLCNAIRMEFGGILEDKIPLNAFPAKIQDMVLALARQENYSIEYMMASLLGIRMNGRNLPKRIDRFNLFVALLQFHAGFQ